MEKRFIIASSNPDGSALGNKLKCLISVIRLSRYLKRKPLLFWSKTVWCGADFSELFKAKIKLKELTGKEFQELIKRKDCVHMNQKDDFINSTSKYIWFDSWRFILLPDDVPPHFSKNFKENDGKCIDLEFERIPLKLRKELSWAVNKLSIQENLSKKIDRFMEKVDFNNVVGLHVRRTDYLLTSDGRGRISTNEKFFNRMNQILAKNPNIRFFLATDCKITQEKFSNAFPNKIIFYPKKNWKKESKEATKEALIDVILLSKTKHILGTFLSTFSEIAWWFSNCKAKVEIMGDKKEKEKVLKFMEEPKKSSIFRPLRNLLRVLRHKSPAFRFLLNKYIEYKTSLNQS